MQTVADTSFLYKDLASTLGARDVTVRDPQVAVTASRYRQAANASVREAKDRQVNEREVEYALYYCRLDMSLTHSALARALRDRSLNDAERNMIIQTLARGDRTRQRFYAHHTFRTRDADVAALIDDQRTIARGVQRAYEQGAIDAKDLLRIADANKDSTGARTFMHILSLSEVACDAGGAAEVLADALWARDGNAGSDRAIAAIHYAASAERMARKLATPARRAEALEVVVRFNASDPFRGMSGFMVDSWKRAAAAAVKELATVHRLDLLDSDQDMSENRSWRAPRNRTSTETT